MLALIPLTLLVGALLALQAGVNTQLRVALGDPGLAALVSFLVGTLSLALLVLAQRPALPDAAALARVPWYAWTGGALGAVYVATVTVLAPRLGAATLTILVVAGQLAMSLVLDHFGLLGFARRPLELGRAAGVALVLAGALLTLRK
ncbi:DMT family transporter [Roseisolibacter sp. H3M3-2]|uniref:DMT family transporter n=1 Tax=Roseisolibacter sp. H3M3-2 TaxID=3031323 RepID=UPI0023DB99A7|nr:DMT family transporter [Roseisolibacter sp. H3M3-2]MDF1505573.1 DMT family transporter [Roseisolibacter sp. H3M3-2]